MSAVSTAQGPARAVPGTATLADLVEAQADRSPHAVAVVDEDSELDYAELDARANQLAHQLRRLGAGRDAPVGVFVERSVDLAVALLATLKAGGACLPLDPSYPAQRLAVMLDDAEPPVAVTHERLAARLPASFTGHVVALDADRGHIAANPSTRPERDAGPDDLAYLIYTSGSTGEPKGVMLPHAGLVNHNVVVRGLYELGPSDRVVQFCSIGFDVSIEEIFPTWAAGGTVVLRPDDLPVLGPEWLEWLRRREITVCNLPTAYWHEWVRDLRTRGARVPECVRLVVVGGEKALGSAYATWLEVGGDRVRWLNAYGPAETSVLATVYEPAGGEPVDRDPPIGLPPANTAVYLLDEGGRPVAAGDTGELYIGGVGVARGYLNKPELTARHFVADPFSDRRGARLYRTGDLARFLPDGNLAFVGRVDDQVKVRGFRVEAREVEGAVARHPAVAEAVVVAREERPGDRRLVAYVVPTGGDAPTPVDLRRFLSERLPPSMVPSAFVRLEELPLTPNGKVDREALPAPGDPRRELPTSWVAPRTSAEEAVADIWSRILGIEDIGADDDFFALGGHSLQATQVIAEVREALGVDIGVRAIFEAPTVSGLAAAAEDRRGDRDEAPPLEPQPRQPGDRIPLTLSQEHMWQLEQAADPPGLFNVTAQHTFSEPVDEDALRRAVALLVERHEPLRTSFHTDADGPYQVVAASVPVELGVSELDPPAADGGEQLRRGVAEQDATPLDLDRAPLLRVHLYRLGTEGGVVAATFDHLVCDGTSAFVFLTELTAAYEAFARGQEAWLRPLPVGYPDFALWQRRWVTDERLRDQLDYWKRKLAEMPLGPAVPLDRVPDRPGRRIATRRVAVPPETYGALERVARETHSTVFVVMVAAAQALFSRLGERTDVVVSTTLSGRQHPELEGLVGCFHGIGRLRTDLSGDPAFATVVERARESVIGLFENQDVPFIRVRREVLPHLPAGGPALLASVPIELQYFHTAHDEWTPGAGVVERPGGDKGPDELFFRGQLHPLVVTFLDDGTRLWGELNYKVDFYDDETIERLAEGLPRLLGAVTGDLDLALSELPVPGTPG